MATHQQRFGVLLRRWRQRRRMTQMDLASIANSSTRHLSYLETGRAQPSREMVMRLAEDLDVPLRERNALLLSAGFAPAFQESSLPELASAHRAIEQILEAHKPTRPSLWTGAGTSFYRTARFLGFMSGFRQSFCSRRSTPCA